MNKLEQNELPLLNICRVCMSEDTEMKQIFTSIELLDEKILLSDMLQSCTSLMIFQGDGLPETICTNCLTQLHLAFSFKKLCELTDATLRKCMEENLENHKLIQDENSLSDKYATTSPDDGCEILESDQIFFDTNNKQVEVTSKSEKMYSNDTKIKKRRSRTKIKKSKLPSTCDICNKTFKFHWSLQRHQLTHKQEKPFLCNICGKSFTQFNNLKIHGITHTGQKPYKCKICDKGFTSPCVLSIHIRTHTGERPYKCNICGQGFTQLSTLTHHTRIHTGEKPLECKICNKRFNQNSHLHIHMRIHSGEKPHECKQCGKSFTVGSGLRRHLRTHSGERPYICDLCGKAFAQTSTLTTHKKIHKKTK